jgi:YVTN family beta-propeller protein
MRQRASSLRTRLSALAVLIGPCASLGAAIAAAPAPDYHVDTRWTLAGEGGWDYVTVEPGRGRLYLSRGDRVEVLNTITGRVFHTIGGTQGVHAVVLAQDLGRGYTTNGRSNSITMFDLASLAIVREVPIPGEVPDAMVYEPVQRRLYAFNARSHDATVLDATTLAVVATLPMPGKPEFAAVDGRGHVYVNIETEEGQLLRIDTAGPTVGATWPMAGCATPTGLALDRERRRAFSTCANRVLAVTDLDDGHVVARVPIGEHPDAAEYDATRHRVLSSNGAGTLSVLSQHGADTYEAGTEVPTQAGARTMALDAESGRVYLVTAEFGPAPAPTPEQPHPRAPPLPGTFTVLVANPR